VAESEKKPVINLVPAILTGTAALLAALTTVYVNVRNDLKSDPQPVAQVVAAQPPAPAPAPEPVLPVDLRLQLQRIAVHEDGAVGTADWRFTVEADGQPLFALQEDSMTSQGGRNVVVVSEDRDTSAVLQLAPGQAAEITVRGWRGRWLKPGGDPVAMGTGILSGEGRLTPVRVEAADPGKGSFTFYFSAPRVRD